MGRGCLCKMKESMIVSLSAQVPAGPTGCDMKLFIVCYPVTREILIFPLVLLRERYAAGVF